MFLDKVVAKSRKGKAGQIVVHSLGGIHKNAAARISQKFEHELTSGREDIIEKIEASGTANQAIQRCKDLLVANPRWSFTRAVAESKSDLAGAIDAYAKGALALNKLAAVKTMYEHLPTLLRDIMKHAIDQEEDCATCFGLGLVKGRSNAKKLTLKCPSCKGSGQRLVSSEHKRWAAQKALEMSQVLPEKVPLVAVQQNQNTFVGGQSGMMEKMSQTADKILYDRPDVVDAEAVEIKDDNAPAD